MTQMKAYSLVALGLLALSLASTMAASAQGLKVLYTFHGSDGAGPETQLALDSNGNIYGTTAGGGASICAGYGCGTVFVISPKGKLLRSYSFNGSNGAYPLAGVVRDSAGNLFGTTSGGGNYTEACGGASGAGCGVVYRLTPSGKETVHRFNGAPGPWYPESLLVQDESGNLYGTSFWGGTRRNGGTAFMITPTGEEVQLFSFPSNSNPPAGMILLNGILYGVTAGSGHYGSSFFQMTTSGEATDIGGIPGTPDSLLAADSAGILYGTSLSGGSNNSGTIFKLSPNSFGGWTYTELYSFCQLRDCADGASPMRGPLVIDSAGNIFGTTVSGGTSQNCIGGCGVVFKLDPNGTETVIHNFTGGPDGGSPFNGLTIDSGGTLYGTATTGGDLTCPITQGCGVVFKITP